MEHNSAYAIIEDIVQINTKKKSNKITALIVALIICLVVVAAAMYALAKKNHPSTPVQTESSSVDYSGPSDEQKTNANTIKESSLNQQKPNLSGDSQEAANTATPGENSKNSIELSITSANQNGSVVQIRSVINAVVSSGICTIRLTGPSEKVVTKTADVQPLASNSTCKGFDILSSDLAAGTWHIALQFENSNLIGNTSSVITIY